MRIRPITAVFSGAIPGLLGAFLAAVLPATAFADNWIVDHDASRLGFEARQGNDGFEGVFERFDAQIVFDPQQLDESHAVVTIDMASASTGVGERDGLLPSEDWFDVGQFPESRFETTAFREVGPGLYEADAQLHIRGVAQDVVLPFSLEIVDDQARVDGELEMSRATFGVGRGDWESPDVVAHEVKVVVDLVAQRSQ